MVVRMTFILSLKIKIQMKKTLLYIFLTLLSFTLAAQHSGYMGKHFIFHYDYRASLAINPVACLSSINSEGINDNHNFEVEYISNKLLSYGFFCHYINTALSYNDNKYARIQAMSIGPSITFYPKLVSPLGGYLKVEAFITCIKEFDLMTIYALDTPIRPGGVIFEIGKQKVFFNRFTYRWGMQTGLSFVGQNSTGLEYAIKERIRGQYFFNFNFGLGVLVF